MSEYDPEMYDAEYDPEAAFEALQAKYDRLAEAVRAQQKAVELWGVWPLEGAPITAIKDLYAVLSELEAEEASG